jgi:ADP-ribosylglycohydrolase
MNNILRYDEIKQENKKCNTLVLKKLFKSMLKYIYYLKINHMLYRYLFMNNPIRNVLLSIITGDALGSGVDGFTKGHIHAHFSRINDYVDPEPALKGRIELWRKPGLYSSISQFMLILYMACARRGPCIGAFSRCIASAPLIPGYDPGIFRRPDSVENKFINRMKDALEKPGVPAYPCARIIPALAPLSFRNNSQMEHITDVITHVHLFTIDLPTLASSLLFSTLLRALMRDNNSSLDPVRKSLESASALADAIESNSADIFALAVNPGALMQEIKNLTDILSELTAADTVQTAEKIICTNVNRKLKTPIIRATVNIPTALFPYSLAFIAYYRNDPSLLYHAAKEGGSTAVFAALCGAIGACLYESVIPDNLLQNLVNRKKILSLADSPFGDTIPAVLMDDFMRSEASLTAKEHEELRARLKHGKKKSTKKTLSRAEKEKEITRHAVESWTKLDKAKWKKERKRRDKNRES